MTDAPADPLTQRALADAIVQRAADQLRDLLVQIATRIRPFPPFPGAVFAYGIEVEPPDGSALGCVVLGDDGALYELQLGLDEDHTQMGTETAPGRHEELVRLDLPPADFIGYAHRAVLAATEVLERRPEARAGEP